MKDRNKSYQVLFIEAHQDDISCISGTAIKLKRAGCQLKLICTTDSRYDGILGDKPTMPSTIAKRLGIAAEECCQVLGVDDFLNLGYEDGFYCYNEKTVKEMISLIRKYRPDIIFTLWPIDNHPDHANTARIVEKAVGLANYPYYREGKNLATDCNVLALYFHQAGFNQTVNFIPDLYVDVSDVMDKIEEGARKFTVPETVEGVIRFVKVLRAYNGEKAGKEYAEAIAKSRKVKRLLMGDPLIEISNKVDFPFLI